MPLKKSSKSSTIPVCLSESCLSHDVSRALRYSTRLFTNPPTASPLLFTASQPKQKHSRAKPRQLRMQAYSTSTKIIFIQQNDIIIQLQPKVISFNNKVPDIQNIVIQQNSPSYGKPNVAIFNIPIFIQFNPYPFNLIFKFIQLNALSFNSIPIIILFNPYSFNSIFRSIQFNFCILDSISLLVQFNFCIRSIQILYSFNLISVFIQFNCFIHSIQLLYSFNSIAIFIRSNFHIHSIQLQSVYIHSIFALIYSILGSGSRGNFERELGLIVKMAEEMHEDAG